MKWLYSILMLGTLSFPLWKSWDPRWNYSSKWIALFPAILLTAAFFLIWDIWFTRMGIWGFNDTYTSSLYFLGLPLEEWFFFIIIPYACIFIYEAVIYYFPVPENKLALRGISISMGIGFLVLAWAKPEQVYTFWCCGLSGLFLIFLGWKTPAWLGHFYIAYLFHLIPFFIVNGVLTGALTPDPIVWYDNFQNLGIRMITIPVEDAVYSFLLLAMNVTLYEHFKRVFNHKLSLIPGV